MAQSGLDCGDHVDRPLQGPPFTSEPLWFGLMTLSQF